MSKETCVMNASRKITSTLTLRECAAAFAAKTAQVLRPRVFHGQARHQPACGVESDSDFEPHYYTQLFLAMPTYGSSQI